MSEILKAVESLLNLLKEFKAADIINVLQGLPFEKIGAFFKSLFELFASLR